MTIALKDRKPRGIAASEKDYKEGQFIDSLHEQAAKLLPNKPDGLKN